MSAGPVDPLAEAVRAIAARDEDRCRLSNGAGFNAADSDFGHKLAGMAPDLWTPKMRRAAWRMLQKYRVQLADSGIDYDGLEEPAVGREQGSLSIQGGLLSMHAPYDEALVGAQKAIPGRRWDGVSKANTFPLASAPYVKALIAKFDRVDWRLGASAQALLATSRMAAELPTPYKVRVTWLDRDRSAVGLTFGYDRRTVESIRRVRGCHWDGVRSVNAFTLDADVAHELTSWLSRHRPVWCEDGVREAIWELAKAGAERERTRKMLAELSTAEDADIEIEGLGGELLPFQRAGVDYVLKAGRRAFIADEPGLGKTVQALSVLHAADAFPAVIVCPASVKYAWRDHVRGPAAGAPDGWLPGRSVAVLEGRSPRPMPPVDVAILNFDILDGWADSLVRMDPKGVVYDESHMLKSPTTLRTKAALRLAEAIPEDGVKLNLSGTAVMNALTEIGSQLAVIGRLTEFGGETAIRRRRSGKKLNKELRRCCFVRRTKDQVMPELPAKRIARVPVRLTNSEEYAKVEADVIQWLVEQVEKDREFADSISHLDESARKSAIRARQSEKAWKAMRAEHLVRLNALRQVCAKGKLRDGAAWVTDFLASSDEKLVIFASHIAVQRALLSHFPGALRIFGEDTAEDRARAVQRFQGEDSARLIVCSLQAAGTGITLTAASNAAFFELGWTPAIHDQAEDRTHRIGQHGSVVAWYLLADGTIDDEMWTLIEAKRALVTAALDGKESTRGESVLDELEARMLAKAGVERDPHPVPAPGAASASEQGELFLNPTNHYSLEAA